MKNFKVILTILIGAIAVEVYSLGLWKPSQEPTPSQTQQSNRDSKGKSVRSLLSRPNKTSDSEKNIINIKCLNEWDELLSLDLAQMTFPPLFDKLPAMKNCDRLPDPLRKVQEKYERSCYRFIQSMRAIETQEEWDKLIKNCLNDLYFYRASMIDWETRDLKLSEIFDLKILANKLIASFGTEKFDRIKEISARMLELDPNFYVAAKAETLSLAIDYVESKVRDEAQWQRAMDSFQRAQALSPNDPELLEMGLAIKSRGFKSTEILKADAQQLIQSQPKSGLGYYFLAYAEWNSGNTTGAQEYLNQALRREPDDGRFTRTLDFIKKHQPGAKGAFEIRMSVKLDSILNS